jgi:oligoribonuclease NrnB/cAMP/cGMP phosphodiesterase (DHH superfamily)
MEEKNDIVVLYHANCPDGFCSAFAFWKKYGDNAEYIPVRHGRPPPPVEGKVVYIVDFSYNRLTLLEMKESAKSLVVLDHHISAEKELGDLDFCEFDMSHSGAYLSWRYLFGESNVPPIVLHVEDRDLWNWKLNHSKEILSTIDSYPKTFEVWDKLHTDLLSPGSSEFLKIVDAGKDILRYKENLIKGLIKSSFKMNIMGYEVPAINISFFQSEIAGQLSEGSPFAAAYHFDGSIFRFSLRSRDGGVDVSEIASSFGGGGHRRAAGFGIDNIDELIGVEHYEGECKRDDSQGKQSG